MEQQTELVNGLHVRPAYALLPWFIHKERSVRRVQVECMGLGSMAFRLGHPKPSFLNPKP